MENNTDENRKTSNNSIITLMSSMLVLLNSIFTAYVLNYKPKTGGYHIWICSFLGIIVMLFTVWVVVVCVRLLKRGEGSKKLTAALMVISVLMGVMWTYTSLPYCKDLLGGSKTVTTDSYLVVYDDLYFLDNEGNKAELTIPEDTAREFRAKENYEYDFENNLLKYYDKITVTYYPESKVIISALAEG